MPRLVRIFALALIALAGCARTGNGPPAPEPVFDLIERLPLAHPGPVGRREQIPAPAEDQARPRLDETSGDLFLPFGSQLDYYLELPPGARLVLEAVRRLGPSGQLELTLDNDEGGSVDLARLSESSRRLELELEPVTELRVVRLRLRALSNAGSEGGFALSSPAVWAHPQEPAPASAVAPGRRDRAEETAARPNILFYLVDTLRADHLGAYGYEKPVSPALDAFAARAVLFENAVAQSSFTKSAVASIFTGRWPAAHGAITRKNRLPDEVVTLAELLREAGYLTVAFSTNPSITVDFGFAQGFEKFVFLPDDPSADAVNREIVSWIDSERDDRPFFLYVHTLDPHDPYLPPRDEHDRFAAGIPADFAADTDQVLKDLNSGRLTPSEGINRALRALYDGEIAANDRAFGDLVEAFERRGLFEDAVTIFISDHGEEFQEHGTWRHAKTLHRESVHVPLVMRLPGIAPRRVRKLVQHVDLMPTLLQYLGLEPPAGLEGESLLGLVAADGDPASRRAHPAYLHLGYSRPRRVAVIHLPWKLTLTFKDGRFMDAALYHLPDDPGELLNRARRFPIVRQYLTDLLRHKLLEPAADAPEASIDAETERRLRALGYLN